VREFFNRFSVLIAYITTALLCWLTCILMVKKKWVNQHGKCRILLSHFKLFSFCELEKNIWIFFLHIMYSLQILYDMHHYNECKHVKCCAWNCRWSVCAEYTSACIHVVSLHYILFYKICAILHFIYTCTRTRVHAHQQQSLTAKM